MEKTALLFPGQGSQCPEMGKDLACSYPAAAAIFDLGGKALGRDMRKLCFESDADTLAMTVNSQPAIFTVSVAALECLKEKGFRYDGVCGFSLGEVAALVAANVISTADGFAVIDKRARAMQDAADKSSGGMAAIIGLDAATVETACKNAGGYVLPVNYNCPGQTVIAGEEQALLSAMELCRELKAMKTARLSVGAAFHSKLMEDAAETLFGQIRNICSAEADKELYSNVTGALYPKNMNVPEYLKVQMTGPVLFEKSIREMIAAGYTTFLECGSGKVLSGLVRRISRDVKVLSLSDVL